MNGKKPGDAGEANKVALQHTVPEFYLRGFTRKNTLATVDVWTGKRFDQNVSKAAAEHHFYSLPGHPDGPNVFEHALERLEGKSAAILRQIVLADMWPLRSDDRLTFAGYLTVQLLRGPDHRRQMGSLAARTIETLSKMDVVEFARQVDSGGQIPSRKTRGARDVDAAEIIDAITSAGGHINQIVTYLPDLVGYILGRPWVLVKFADCALLTSDTPLSPYPIRHRILTRRSGLKLPGASRFCWIGTQA
jgi:Protein of unknown function (DUF4238)